VVVRWVGVGGGVGGGGGILASFILHDKVARNVSHPIKRFIWITLAAYSTRVQTLPIRVVLWIVKATCCRVSGRRWQIPTLRDIHSLRNCSNGHGNSISQTSHLYAVRGHSGYILLMAQCITLTSLVYNPVQWAIRNTASNKATVQMHLKTNVHVCNRCDVT
jgi:hypothetical protein